jgi:hypothetical protein
MVLDRGTTTAFTSNCLKGTTCWLLVERLENWRLDRQDGFQKFGLPDRKVGLGRLIKKGDLLFFYVSSGRSCFADIREAREPSVSKLRLGGDYDMAFPWCVLTKPLLTLPPEAWVPIQSLIAELSFTRGRADWRQLMRNTLRKLETDDAAQIMRAMQSATKKKEEEL